MAKLKLTKTQREIVTAMQAGSTLVESFDVWGGYAYWLISPDGETRLVSWPTFNALRYYHGGGDGIIRAGECKRLYSGRRDTNWTLNLPEGTQP